MRIALRWPQIAAEPLVNGAAVGLACAAALPDWRGFAAIGIWAIASAVAKRLDTDRKPKMEVMMSRLEDMPREIKQMLAKIGNHDDEPKDLPPMKQIQRLQEVFKRYADCQDGCPFKPGDIVTPLRGCSTTKPGTPAIVLEVRENPEPTFSDAGPGSSGFGHRLDIRIARMHGETYAPFWAESFDYEIWEG